jgi:hypothetical protein
MANALGAKIQNPSEIKPEDTITYDLIGFGSGIYRVNTIKAFLNWLIG